MNFPILLIPVLLLGCAHTPPEYKCNGDKIHPAQPTVSEIRTGDYDGEWVKWRADQRGMRTVDYLHRVSSGQIRP